MTDNKDTPCASSIVDKDKDSAHLSAGSRKQPESGTSHHISGSIHKKSVVNEETPPAAATAVDNERKQLDATSTKRPRKHRKKKTPVTGRNVSIEPASNENQDDSVSIQHESAVASNPSKPKKKRSKKPTKKSKSADLNHEDVMVTATATLDEGVVPSLDSKKKKKKKGAAATKNPLNETVTNDGRMNDAKVETAVVDSAMKKPKEKKKRQKKKKTDKVATPRDEGVPVTTLTTDKPYEAADNNKAHIALLTTKEHQTTAPTIPSFNAHYQRRRRMVDNPPEEIQFGDLSQPQPTSTDPHIPTSSRKPPKPLAAVSDNSAMPRRDPKKKLSSTPILDPKLSLQNYFVPAKSQMNEPSQALKQDHQKNIHQMDNHETNIHQTVHHQKERLHKGQHLMGKQQNSLDHLPTQSEQHDQQDGNSGSTKPKSARKAKKERRMQRIKKAIAEEQQQAKQHASSKQNHIEKKQQITDYIHPDDHVAPGRRQRYDPYMAPKLIKEAIENGTLYQGIIRINRRNRADSYVTSDDLEYDIYIQGLRDRNRALEGDMVAVRLLDVDTIWNRKKYKDSQKKQNQSSEKASSKDVSNVGVEVETDDEDNIDKNKPKLCGQIVGILHRMEGQQYTGTLHIDRHAGPSSDSKEKDDEDDSNDESGTITPNNNHVRLLWLKPTDKRAPLIAIPVSHAPDDFLKDPSKYKNEIFAAKATRWPIDSQYPFGKLVSDIGPLGEMSVEAESILANNNIQDTDFSAKALKALPKTPWRIPEKEYKNRRDLRSGRIFTIDPETAKDLDDALHITRLENEQYEVGVHIADVSYFLKPNTQLDVEAKNRATSTYLVDRVIPMLPSLLCEQLCSLNPDVERLAFSVIWKMDSAGNILDTWFGRTIIKSCAKLAYDDAQSVIDKNGLPATAKVVNHSAASVEQDILDLHKLSLCMRKRRFENGALSMNSIKLSFKLDDDGEPVKVWVYQLKESNRLIEEFMLRANMSVAEKICEQYPGEAMLRRHEPPIERRLDEFISVAQSLGYYIDGSTSGTLQSSFDAIESEDVKYVLRILAIKPMRRAKYFCVGSFEDTSKYLHFALNVPMYTHFTSPIRRYADVIVHRQLESILKGKGECGYSKKVVQAIALQCNRKKDGAKNAQEQSGHLYLSRYLARLSQTDGPVIRDAIVLQVNSDVFDLLVPDYGLESRVYMDAMPLERFLYDADVGSLTVFWKEAGVMNMDTIDKIRETNKATDDSIHTTDKSKGNTPNTDLGNCTKSTSKSHEGSDQCQLGTSKRMQKFKTFTKFSVMIQVNIERTPPIINIYPVNPFMK